MPLGTSFPGSRRTVLVAAVALGASFACNNHGDTLPMKWSTELTAERLTFIGPGPAGHPWIAGQQLWERRGTMWATVPVAEAGWNTIRPGPNDQLWATSRTGQVAFRDAAGWHAASLQEGRTGVDVAAFGDEAWVTGTHNRIHRWTADQGWTLWKPEALAMHHTGVIWGASADDVWVHAQPQATGRAPDLAHWNGESWTLHSLSSKGYIAMVHGRSSTDVWAVGWTVKWLGKGPLAAHWDGKEWTEVDLPSRQRLTAVHVQQDGTVWLSGHGGTLLRGNRSGFSALQAPDDDLNGVYADEGGNVWVLGDSSRVYHTPIEDAG